jgi:hypothetical protein
MTTVRITVLQQQWSLQQKKNTNNNNNVDDLVVCLSRVFHVATLQGNAFSVENFSHCLI